MVGQNKSWEEVLLQEREENSRLRQQRRDQEERERRLAQRLLQLKDQQQALHEGKAVDAVGRDGKIKALQDQLANLNLQNKELEAKLQAAKVGGGAPSSGPKGAHGVPRPGPASKGGHPDSMNAAAKVEELKRKLLETNRQIVEIVEKQKTSDLLSTLDLYKSEMGQEGLGMVEREELRNELKLKEAKYVVAKAEYDKLDKEYKEYVEKHKQLEEQAKSIQEQILIQEKQKREIERDIKQMKLERDSDSDQKNILGDLKEELFLLKEENKQLNEDSMSGKSLVEKSKAQDTEVERLREENDKLVKSIEEKEGRKKALNQRLQDAQKLQATLAKEVAEKSREVENLNQQHKQLVSNLRDFSMDPESKNAAGSTEGRSQRSHELLTGAADERSEWVAQACDAMDEQLATRNTTADAAFDSWDTIGDGRLSQDDFVEGVMGLRAGLQRDEARQLYMVAKGDEEQLTKTKFKSLLEKSGGGSGARSTGGASSEAQILEGELRKLRTLNAQLLKEKDELFQTLREAERARRGQAAGSELAQAERLQDIEQMHAAQLRKLQDDLAVAEYNQQDLLQLIDTYDDTRVRKPGAPANERGGPRTTNVVVIEISSMWLDAGREGMQEELTTFFSVDFYVHDTQVTPPCTGFDVSIGWSCEFEVEEDDLFLGYLDTDALSIELMQRMNADTPFKSLASCRVALKGLLDRASLINQAVDLLAADGSKLGQAVVTMRMQHSIFAAVERYRRSERSKMQPVAVAASSGVLEALGVPLDKIQLAVTILSCDGLRGTRYGALPWPYCQYELPVKWPEQEPTHVTETRTKEANPVYNDRKVWDIPTPELAVALRAQELDIFVFDDQDQNDLQPYLGFAKVRLVPIFLPPAQPLKATLDLKDARGVKNGTITICVEWHTAAGVAAEAQRKAMEQQRAAFGAPITSIAASTSASGVPPKAYQKRKVAKANVGGSEEEWLEMLRNRIKEVGDNADKVFASFDKDSDGEICFDDFSVSMDNEPLGLDAQKVRLLFEFIAGAKDKNISKAKWREAIAPGTFGILPADKQHVVLLYRHLSFLSTSPMWEEILGEKGAMRLAIVTDWFGQPEEDTLGTSGAKRLLVTARMAAAEFGHKQVFRMDERVNRMRVQAVLEKSALSESDMIRIFVCKVTSDGKVLLDDYVGAGLLDIKTLLRDKADVFEFSLQLINQEGKGVAKLTLDTGVVESLVKLSTGGVGAVAASMSTVEWEAAETAKLAQLLASKGMSATASFTRFDENCDDELDWREFEAGIRNEPLQHNDAQRRQLFDYLCAGKETIDRATWKAKMASATLAASGIVSAQEAKHAIILVIKNAQVNAKFKKDKMSLCVRADFVRSNKMVSTEVRPLLKDSNSVELNDRLTMSLKADSSDAEAMANRKRLTDAFASKSPDDAKIDVVLVGVVDGRQFELGVAALNLKKLLRDGDNLQDFTLMPESEGASVGKVVLSLYFIQALKELNVDGKQAASVSSGGGGGSGDGASAGRAGSAAGGGGGSSSGVGSDGAASEGGSGVSGSGVAKTSATTSEGGVTKKALGGGNVTLTFSELRLEAGHSFATDDKVKNVLLSANFFGQQSDREVANARSAPILIDDLRAGKYSARGGKNTSKQIKHSVKFDMDDSLYAANKEALSKVLSADENATTGLVTLVLYRGLYSPAEYSADDMVFVAKGQVSVNDLFHASLLDDEKKEVALKDNAGAVVAHCNVFAVFDLSNVSLPAVNGHTPFKKDEMDHNVMVHIRQLQTMSSAKLRGIASIALAVKLEGDKEIVSGSRTRALSIKDLTAGGHQRGDLRVNHKVLLPLAKLAGLREALLDKNKKCVPVKLILLNAGDDSEVAECEIDLKKDALDKGEDMAKKEAVFFDNLDGTTKVAKAVVDVAVLQAYNLVHIPTPSAAVGASTASSKTPSEMVLVVEKVQVAPALLADDKVSWFGIKEERTQAVAPLAASASLPLKHEFKLDVLCEHKSNTTFMDVVSERLAQESTRGGGGDVQIFLVAQLDGAGADKVLASGTIDVGAMLFDGPKHGDGARDIFLAEGAAADVAVTAQAAAGATSGTKISIHLGFRQALGLIAVRLKARHAAAPRPPTSSCVVLRKEGSQPASKAEKESNIVVGIKSVELSSAALSNNTSAYNGPLFLALDFFGEESDAVAVGGTEAYLRQQRLPIVERFLCPVDSAHEHNRKQLKEGIDKKEMRIGLFLFHEPWKSGARAWASCTLAESDFRSREGADIQVQLKDEGTGIADVILQVHSAEAFKMLGY